MVYINIANDPVSSIDYKEEFDPAKFRFKKTNGGPLGFDWIDQLRSEKSNRNPAEVPDTYVHTS